jgi:hypothetical protein
VLHSSIDKLHFGFSMHVSPHVPPSLLLLLFSQVSGSAPGLRRSLSCYSSCYLVLDLSANPWRVVHMNEPAREATGEHSDVILCGCSVARCSSMDADLCVAGLSRGTHS